MPLYTFYPCRLDDTSLGFETYELIDDGEAMLRTLRVLAEHPSAEFVVVWCGDRKALVRYRVAPELEAELSRPRGQWARPGAR
jgi:hypothetical protein